MIKNIIFDLGGVIFDIRYENIAEAFAQFGVHNFAEKYTQAAQTEMIDLFEEGKVSIDEFRQYIRSLSDVQLSDNQIDTAWNAIMIDIPEERVALLQKVKKNYNIFLFSNTNALNYNAFHPAMKQKFGYDIFAELFVHSYFSHFLHIRKPHPAAFQQILHEQQLIPQETLFIDDTERHIEGAKSVGLHTFLLKKNQTMLDLFDAQSMLKIEPK